MTSARPAGRLALISVRRGWEDLADLGAVVENCPIQPDDKLLPL